MKKKKPFTSYKAYWWKKKDSNEVFYGKTITDITDQAFGKGIPYRKWIGLIVKMTVVILVIF